MRVVSFVGPSHGGKSTLIAALAGLDSPRSQSLKLDGDGAVTKFSFMDEPWAALECPGGPDSMALLGPALAASDAAVLCVPAEADAAVLAAPYLRVLEENGLPTLVFVNKLDSATDRVADIVAALQVYCAHGMVLRQVPMRDGDTVTGAVDLISERAWEYHDGQRSSLVELPGDMRPREEEARAELLEHLADFDDHLMEQLIEDQTPLTDEIYEIATRVLRRHDLVPVLLGAASHSNGVMRLMKSLRHEVPGVERLATRLAEAGDIRAAGCFADTVKHLGKTVLLRAISGPVASGDSLGGDSVGTIVDIDTKTGLGTLQPGEVGLTVKTDQLQLRAPLYTATGAETLADSAAPRLPNHRVLIAPVNERDETRLSTALTRLTEIDPGLTVGQDEQSGQAVLATLGPLHLRRVIDKLDSVFGVPVETADIPPALRETIRKPVEVHHRHRKQSGGAGQFADVVIAVRPLERGAAFAFDEEIKGGAVPRNYIPAVETGAREALTEGPIGFPVVDVGVLLKDGKHHSVDSSDFAFRTAGRNAVREALGEAGTVAMQPISHITIHVPSVYSGGLVPLVSGMKGQVLNFEADPAAAGWDVFQALLPRAGEAELFNALGGATRGTAWFGTRLDHYEEARDLAKTQAAAG